MNIGEEIVCAYLKHIKNCQFVEKNLYTEEQGEIDIVGIEIDHKIVYLCEVAVHIQGLLYVNPKDNTNNNVNKLVDKFSRCISYAEKHFPDYTRKYMFWSPIVKSKTRSSKPSQIEDVAEVRRRIKELHKVQIDTIINHQFQYCLLELREYALKESKELKNPVLRMMQIEENLMKHISHLEEDL